MTNEWRPVEMRYLIVGSGLVGLTIAERLRGDEVVVFDLEPRGPEGATLVRGDVRDLDALVAAAQGVDGIFHTAALHGIHSETHPPEQFISVNVVGAFNVLEAAKRVGVPRVVHSSTAGVIGDGDGQGNPGRLRVAGDDPPCRPYDYYGESKLLAEGLCEFYGRRHGLQVVALRYGGVRQLVSSYAPDLRLPLGWAIGGLVTDVRDCAAANLAAMRLPELPPQLAYLILPTTLLDDQRLRRAGGSVRAALLDAAAWLADADLPEDIPMPQMAVDASRVERDLGFRFAYGQDDYLREALGLGEPTGDPARLGPTPAATHGS